MTHTLTRVFKTLFVASVTASLLQGCVPLVALGVGTAGVTSTMDRRSYGSQLEDNEIELKAKKLIDNKLGKNISAGVTSVNRWVLLTGQALTDADKAKAEALIRTIPNVTQVFNELTIGPAVSFGTISNDSLITSKVKSNLVGAKEISTNRVKVTTENSVVYLMGIVTQRESEVASYWARKTSGVTKVVTVFDVISETEAKKLDPSASTNNTQVPSASSNQNK